MNTTRKPASGKRTAAIGVTAGLLGGGAIGLMMTMPSITSAASEVGSTEAAVMALQDTDTETDDTATDEQAPERGERLRELLQELVDEGTITAAQADAVTEHVVENAPEGRHHRHRHHRGPARDGEVLAGLLGIDTETLRDELRSGDSIADIAAENGVDVQTVIDALVDEVSGHLDLMVEDGRLTAEEAEQQREHSTERITARVNGERPGRG